MRILGTSNENYAGSSDSEVRLRGVYRGVLLCQLVPCTNSFTVANPNDIDRSIWSMNQTFPSQPRVSTDGSGRGAGYSWSSGGFGGGGSSGGGFGGGGGSSW